VSLVAERDERRQVLAQAYEAVDRVITPLGYGGGATNSPWNAGYEQAKNESLNAIYALMLGNCPLEQRHALLIRCSVCGATPATPAKGESGAS
jgi:hypothetical protein